MAVVRGVHRFDKHFTQIPNSWARDSRLSLKARGVLVLIMSHEPGWRLTVRSLAGEQRVSRDALTSALQELERLGYLKRHQENQGRFGEAVWTTTDPEWQENQASDWQEKPATEKQATKKTIYKNTIKNINSDFEKFWEHYPRKVGKIAALKMFAKASEETPTEWIIEGARRFASDPNLPPVQFIPYPATWLGRGSWEDGPLPERIKTPDELKAEAEDKRNREAAIRALRIAEDMRLQAEQDAQARAKSAPAPKCPHGENVALCKACL